MIPEMSTSVPAVDSALAIREGDIFAPKIEPAGNAEGEFLQGISTLETVLVSFEVEDTNRDGNVTALDAFVVVNTLSRLESEGDADFVDSLLDVNGERNHSDRRTAGNQPLESSADMDSRE